MSKRRRKGKAPQRSFEFIGWGGKRRGAGRKRCSLRSNHDHLPQPSLAREYAAHVTLRLQPALPNLRERPLFAVVLDALSQAAFGLFFRIVEFSVQKNHIHLLVEATNSIAGSSGMKSLVARLSRSINEHLVRSGPVLADRYHLHVIHSPREARAALHAQARGHAEDLAPARGLEASWASVGGGDARPITQPHRQEGACANLNSLIWGEFE